MPKADIILITHHHKDHCKAVTVKRLLKKDGIIFAPKSCKKELGEKIRIVQPNETLTIKNIVVHTLNAYNTPEGSSTTKQHKLGEGIGYILDICGKRIYHAGDTDVIPDMSKLGKIDIAMLPIGGRFTMNSKEAIEAVKIIKPSMVIPMHNLDRSMLDFVEEVEKQTESTAISMEIGGIFHLKI